MKITIPTKGQFDRNISPTLFQTSLIFLHDNRNTPCK
ncbi:hypothetical protein PARMER_04081 [Parabacteroides merdae ATCC 43184]|nr:hypothetical protein PARMER_04081 [Parabacteroides merdae ATCC 43184]